MGGEPAQDGAALGDRFRLGADVQAVAAAGAHRPKAEVGSG